MDLKKWLRSEFGVSNLEHLEISYFKNTGRGIKSCQDIESNETIIKLPLTCLMTGIKLCEIDRRMDKLRNEFNFEYDELLLLFLTSFSSGTWDEYRKSIPDQIPSHFDWSQKDIDNLPAQLRRYYRQTIVSQSFISILLEL
jgi:hypothetical protein